MIGTKEHIDIIPIRNKHVDYICLDVLYEAERYIKVINALEEAGVLSRNKKKNEIIRQRLQIDAGLHYQTVFSLLSSICSIKIRETDHYYKAVSNRKPIFANLNEFRKNLDFLKNNIRPLISLEYLPPYVNDQKEYKRIKNGLKGLSPIIHRFISYDNFRNRTNDTEWNAYKLTRDLGIKSCPYCNRQYTSTIYRKSKKVTRPQLDHFLPRKDYPLLELSFYNLIPSCYVCNSNLKNDKTISHENFLSPYEDNPYHQLMRFDYWPDSYLGSIGETEEINITVKYNGDIKNTSLKQKIEGNIELFELHKLYNDHKDIVQEIIKKRHLYSDDYLETLRKSFPKLTFSPEDAFNIIFSNYFSEKDFVKRPFSKITKDIVTGLLKASRKKPVI